MDTVIIDIIYPRRPSSTAVPKLDPRRPRRPPDGLILGPPGHVRPPHTPLGHCGRLGWPVVTCGGHPQPSRRPRTPFRYCCPRVCGSPAGDSGDLCRHQRDGMGSCMGCPPGPSWRAVGVVSARIKNRRKSTKSSRPNVDAVLNLLLGVLKQS